MLNFGSEDVSENVCAALSRPELTKWHLVVVGSVPMKSSEAPVLPRVCIIGAHKKFAKVGQIAFLLSMLFVLTFIHLHGPQGLLNHL